LRHEISRLPEVEGSKPKATFKAYPIGFFHIDIAEVRTEEGKLICSWPSTGPASSPSELHERVTRRVAADFLRRLAVAAPYRIHTVLTDNGTHFTEPAGGGWKPADIRRMTAAGEPFRCHAFELACADLAIEHRLTKPNHPWTNGQVERMNRTVKEATVRRYHYETHDELRAHLSTFLEAYNFARRLKTLRGLTPFEFISQQWTSERDLCERR
jgi:transposase InsO family protein